MTGRAGRGVAAAGPGATAAAVAVARGVAAALALAATAAPGAAAVAPGSVAATAAAVAPGSMAAPGVAAIAPGSPDPLFGGGAGGGIVLTAAGAANAYARAVVVQPGGGIVTVGEAFDPRSRSRVVALVRHTPAGALDTGFGRGGIATAPASGPVSAAAAPGGAIVAVGQGARGRPLVARFSAEGALAGEAAEPPRGGEAVARAVTVGPDGRVAVAADTRGGAVILVRYSSALRPEGIARIALPGFALTAAGVATDRAGRLVVAGTAYDVRGAGASHPFVATPGAPPALIRSGLKSFRASALALAPDGAAVVAGSGRAPLRSVLAAVRFTAAGRPDPGFGIGGVATVPPGPGEDAFATAVALDRAGMVVLAGTVAAGERTSTALVRLTTGGALDPTFAPSAAAAMPGSAPAALALDAGDDLVVAGSAYASGREVLSLARFEGGAPPAPPGIPAAP
jgi:uncharacterized delta-60 repeat protein